MRRYRNRRYARRFYRKRRNNYFKQHSEQARYAKLITVNNTVKRVISVDDDIFVFNSAYSFSHGSSIYSVQAQYQHAKDYQDYAALYTLHRLVGVKVTIYKSCVPEVLVSESVDKEFGLLGFNLTIGQAIAEQQDVENADTTYWLSFLGAWSTQSKFFSLTSKNGTNKVTDWQPSSAVALPTFLNIATRGNVSLPSGWKMFYVSIQFMCEFANPI